MKVYDEHKHVGHLKYFDVIQPQHYTFTLCEPLGEECSILLIVRNKTKGFHFKGTTVSQTCMNHLFSQQSATDYFVKKTKDIPLAREKISETKIVLFLDLDATVNTVMNKDLKKRKKTKDSYNKNKSLLRILTLSRQIKIEHLCANTVKLYLCPLFTAVATLL